MPAKIVVPLDESEVSEAAIPVARAFAADSGAEVLLVSVVDVSTEFASWMGDSSDSEDFQHELNKTQEYLDQVATRFGDTSVQTIVRSGRPEVEILSVLDETADPVVVMSSHGRSGFNRLLVGSVTNRIVASAECPVVVVRAAEEGRPAADIQAVNRILVPLDGSEFAENALEAVQSTLASKPLTIHLVRIPEAMTWATPSYGTGAGYYQMIDTYMEVASEEAQEYLEKVAARLKERGHEVAWEVRTGMSSTEIASAAEEHNVDLIVMATHGRTGFRRVVMGSVAERVLRDANTPVMLVSPNDDD